MTPINRPQNAPSIPGEAAATVPMPARRLSAELIFESVVAGYIHDISERHHPVPRGRDRLARAGALALS